MIGKTISHYRILEKIGEGGMGVVYKAEDTKLKRIVALKFLSVEALSVEEKSRFLREAQAAAALNHPNICTVYAIDEIDGEMFIAMEFIEGQNLREKIEAGPLKIAEAIKLATQIAEGLQAAHEKGITHRDIKSANIMITEKGQAKIMDFGLAKLARGGTLLTKEGMTLGTAAYMSPEQTRGEVVDQRTDIWSLGVVLYEMASGQLPFRGEYEQAIMYSIVQEDPQPLTALRTGVPLALDSIVAKALAKDPTIRYQHVDEIPADLRAIEAKPGGTSKIPTKSVVTTRAALPKRTLLLWAITALMTLVAAIAFRIFLMRPTSPERLISRSLILPPEKTTFNMFVGGQLAISPDGQKVAFVAADSAGVDKLWVRSLNALTSVSLNNSEGASYPFWSPDSRWLGFFSGGKLKKMDAAGGPVLMICDAPNGRGGAWNKDGVILFAPNDTDALFKVAASGGTPVRVTTLDSTRHEGSHRWPCFLPDGNHFVFTTQALYFNSEADAIKLGTLEASTSTVLLPVRSNAVYASGFLVFMQEGTLMARSFDSEILEFAGETAPIVENAQPNWFNLNSRGDFSVSQNSVLILQAEGFQGARQALFDRRGNCLTVFPELPAFSGRFSPDGRRIAFVLTDSRMSTGDVWVRDLSRKTTSRLTFDPAIENGLVWSPDGRALVFNSNREGRRNIFMKNIDGTGNEQLLLKTDFDKMTWSWSRDRRYLAFTAHTATKTGTDLWLLPVSGDRQPVAFLQTEFEEDRPRLSPDGGWVVYVSNETGREEIYVRALDGSGEKWQVSTDGGLEPIWPGEGREIFFSSLDRRLMVAEVKIIDGKISIGAARTLFDFESAKIVWGNVDDVSSDGKTIIALVGAPPQTSPLTLVINWDAEVKR